MKKIGRKFLKVLAVSKWALLVWVAFAGASARAAAWSTDWANKDLSYLQPKELANSDTWKTIYDVKGLDPASPEYMFGYTHGNAWQNSIDWAVRDPDDREKSIRKVVHYEFRPTAEGIAAWTSDAHEGYLTGFEDPNRVDYFAVALPQKTPLANPPAGRGLVVQLHGRCGGAAGDKSLSVIGSTDRPNSVFYAPADMYALSLECLENIFSDYWYGSMPPPETVNKASITLNAGAKVTHWDSKAAHALRRYSWEDMGMRVTEDVSRADYNGSASRASDAYIISAYGFQGEIFSGPKKGAFAHYSRREDMTCIRWNSKESPVVRKLLDTIEWVVRKYDIDRNRIYITGNSMGGQGALALGMTHGEIFAAVNANVPATVWFAAARLGLVNEDGSDKPLSQVSQPAYDPPPVFDWSGSDDAWSRDHDVIYRNADRMRFHYQGWWGNYGHCDSVATARATNDVTFVGVDVFSFARNRPYAVFSGSNVNTPLPWPQDNYVDGDSGESEVPVSGGTEQASGFLTRRAGTPAIGQWNAFVKADIVTETASKLEADLWIPGESELPTTMYERPEIAVANVSFRRLQNFPHGAGQKVRWTYAGGSGVMPLDRCNLFTVENAWMTGSKRRLTLVPTSDAVTPVGSVKVASVAMSGATGTATVELNLVDKAGLASVPYAIEYATNESFSGAVAGPSGSLSNLGATSVSVSGLAKNQRYYLRAKLNNGATVVTTYFLVQGSNRTSVVPPTIPSQVYTGAVLVPAVPTSADWTVLPNQSWTGAGTHKVKLQLTDPDHKKWSTDAANDVIEVDFVIEKADPKWTVEPKLSADSWKADGTPATYTAGTVSSGATTFERYLEDDWFAGPAEVDGNRRAFTGAFPTAGGCYRLIVKVPESANWKELVWEKRFMVVGREATTVTDVRNATDSYPIGNDTVLVFAETNAVGSFTLTQATKVELLMVGGGGAGGCFAGGGGGAGGVIQASSLVLPAGDYVAQVGLGGAKQRMYVEDGTYINGQGSSGGDSVLSNRVGSVLHRAVGGSGGGGCADINGGRWYASVDGGSSGGCGAMFAPAYAKSNYSSTDGAVGGCVAGQGHMGGAGWGDSASAWGGFAGGGGGAGTTGEKGGSQASGHAGNGGDGILSAITGVSLYWGAGGGGSMAPADGKDYKIGWLYAMATSGGEGGKGGGGHGATARLIRSFSGFGGSPEKMAAVHAATGDGSFYGAGGGGGGAEGWYYNGFHGTENEWVLGYGGFGYQGIVIVRLTPYVPEAGHVHTYVETVETEPTCTVNGRKLVECVCGDKHYETIPATGKHTPVTVPQVDPTCTAVGATEWTKCAVCGQQLTAPSEIAMLPHFYVDGHCKSCGKEQSHEEQDKKLTRDGLSATGATVVTRETPGYAFLEDDVILIWTAGTGTFTIDAPATARVLCVGGGGSGAQENTNGNAGGGGAGGFADFHNTFNAGTYTVTVGEGGAAVANPNAGKPGTASSIVFDKLDIVRAEGGTGGKQGYPNPNTQPHGGNGGAVTHPYAITTDEIPVCGFEGAVKGGSNTGAGGAGASARGEGRKGGAGCTSDITGELVEYAGGGGGGGHIQWTVDIPGTYGAGNSGGPSAATAARANSGSGGGAGAKVNAKSGAGGSGIVVVRFTLADHEHVWVNEKVVTSATCGADGLKTANCSVAGCSVVHYETIPATGAHNSNVVIPGVDATCTNEGWTVGAKCSVCGTVVVERQKIEKKAHASVGYEAVESTCTQHGHEAGTRCSFCGVNLTGGAELPLAEHEPVDIVAVPASCTKTGFTAGTVCKFCEEPLSGHEVVPLQPHQYGANGKCTVCGHESHGLAGVTYSGATKSTVGTDILLVYDNPDAVGTLQLEDWMNAWVLVVGGGGSGANDHGNSWAGGGGGGGFVEERGFRLPSGSYTITVGKGGAGAAQKSSGNRGGDSSLVGAGVNLVGFGGGAGGYNAVGGNGGCGGGGGLQNKGGAASQGYSVDWASLPRGNSGTGGGGMGSAGTMGRISAEGDFPLYGGIGGDGKASWITGAEVLYGAGGGGAGQLGAGPGGAGGGGTGARGNTSDEEIKKLIQRGTAGKNGVGAGGGADNAQGTGCAGGSGVVIVRIVPDEGRTIVGIPEIANKVYNGSAQVATVPASAKYTVTSNAGGIHGGEYAVTLKLTDAAHDRWAGTAGDTVTVKWHITPATNKWTTKPTVTANSWLFGSGDTPSFPQPAAQFGNDTMKITYNGQVGAACWPSEPGVYRVTFTIPASSDVKELTGFVDVAMWDPLGPKIAVLGDSYSHHHDFSTWGDASYHNSYPTEAFGLTYVGDMWWAKLAQTLGGSAKSYAQGSCGYSYLGNNMDAAHASVAKDHSLIKQVDNLDPDTEVIILFAGLNDDYNTKISKKTDYADDWHLSKPWESNESLLNDLYPAVCCVCDKIKARFPDADVFFVLSTRMYPTDMSTCATDYQLGFQFGADTLIAKVAKLYFGENANVLQLLNKKSDPFTKQNGHPNVNGARMIYDQVLPFVQAHLTHTRTECAHPTTEPVAAVDATCTLAGFTAGTRCTVCGKFTSGHAVIPALGHQKAATPYIAAEAADCTHEGHTAGYLCDRCHEICEASVAIPALGHHFVNGECDRCHERELEPSGKTKIAVPTAVGGLAYTGKEQTGVNGGTGYTLTGNVGTDAKGYTATAKLTDAAMTEWDDGTTDDKTVAWSIAKATNTWTTEPNLSKTIWTVDGPAATVTDAVAKFGTVTKTLNDAAYTAMPTEAGKYTLTWSVAGTSNYSALSASKSFSITTDESLPFVAKWAGNRTCAVTHSFDDGVADHYAELFPVLQKHDLRATFCLVGQWIEQDGIREGDSLSWGQAKTMGDCGQEIGNGGYAHLNHTQKSEAECQADVSRNSELITKFVGKSPKTFAPPDGAVAGFTANVLAACGIPFARTGEEIVGSNSTADQLDGAVAAAKSAGSWKIFSSHGISHGTGAYANPNALFTHLAHLASDKAVWADTLANVHVYKTLYEKTGVTVTKTGATTYSVAVTAPSLDRTVYDQWLDLVLPDGSVRSFDPFGGNFTVDLAQPAANSWVTAPAITKHVWQVGNRPGWIRSPVPRQGRLALVRKLNGAAWDGTMPTTAGDYTVTWEVPATTAYAGLSTSLQFKIIPTMATPFPLDHTIVCYGDSLTAGAFADPTTIGTVPNYFNGRLNGKSKGDDYPYELALRIPTSYNVIAQAKTYMFTDNILSWFGRIPLFLGEAISLRADTTPVASSVPLLFDGMSVGGYASRVSASYPGMQPPEYPLVESVSGNGAAPGSVTGWLGFDRVRWTGTGYDIAKGRSYARADAGVAKTVQKGTPFLPESALMYEDAIHVVFAGTNDGAKDYESVLPMIQSAVYEIPSGRYIVISSFYPDWGALPAARTAFAKTFGAHHIDLYDAMSTRGLSSAVELGLLTQEQVDAAEKVAYDAKPAWRALLIAADNNHLNSIGYTVLAEFVKEKLIELNYIEGGSKTRVTIPTAIAGLTYDGTVKTGIRFSTRCNVSGYTATDAGTYEAVASLKDTNLCEWEDGSTTNKTISWTIAKAENGWSKAASITKTAWTVGGTPGEVTDPAAKFGTVVKTLNGAAFTAMPTVIGEYTLSWTVAETKNFSGITTSLSFSIRNQKPQQPAGDPIPLETLHWTGATTNWVGNDLVLVWANPGQGGGFTLDAAATGRILCVGGGGSGAQENTNGNAGGGGAGGFADFHNAFAEGTYTVTVGAGGAGVTSGNAGRDGSASSLLCGEKVIVASEGGTGGKVGYPNPNTQPHGGNGGAVTHPYAVTADEIPACGFTGAVKGNANTGGAGAGACGNGEGRKGGAGTSSDILGEELEYAGGGGGGGHIEWTIDIAGTYGAGNSGGPSAATAARANSGAGGGGGAKQNATSGAGGSGIVVVRFMIDNGTPPTPGHTHSYTSSVTTEPTCVKTGVRTYTCSCGASYTETIPATGVHTPEEIPAVTASCTNVGYTAGSRCTVCEQVLVAPTEVPMTEHQYVDGHCTGCGRDEPVDPPQPPQPPSGAGIALEQIHWTNAETNWIGNDLVIQWKSGEGTLTLDAAATGRILCVGGGGSGGWQNVNGRCGGGGAGGFADFHAALAGGAYAITVGAGGAGNAYAASQDGGDSSVVSGGSDIVRSTGGKGGDSVDNWGWGKTSAGGDSGAASAPNALSEPTPILSVSHAGKVQPVGNNVGGGGAGASADGVSRIAGDGYTSDITGEAVEYAGGGGGGGHKDYTDTLGGVFGGGDGGGKDGATSARANSGAGGGASATTSPGNGGSGIVVMRFTIGGGDTPEPPQEEPPSIEGGEEIDFENDMTNPLKVNSSRKVVFPSEPKVSGNVITYGGKTVEMPAYYQITVVKSGDDWKLTLALDADAVRPEIDGAAAKPFVVGEKTVEIAIDNVEGNLYYGVETSTTLDLEATWNRQEPKKGSDLTADSLTADRPEGSAAFFRVYVTDVP